MNILGSMLDTLRITSQKYSRLGFGDRIESLSQEFDYLVDFMRKGYDDPKRRQLYSSLRHRVLALQSDFNDAIGIQGDAYLSSLKSLGAGKRFCSAELILLLRETTNDIVKHNDALEEVFSAILISPQWSEQDSRLWTAFLLSADIPSDSVCVIVSAITIACGRVFSIEKYRTLVYTYLTSDDETVRQRALVGWVFTISLDNEQFRYSHDEIFRDLLEDEERVKKEVVEMMMQVVRCSQVEKDNRTFENDIMPQLLDGNPLKMNRDGILEKEDDPMEEILNPGASEQRMERMEKSIQKMLEMQKDGSDLYYKGFSQMKRYPFFYKIHNWFLPFSLNIPEVDAVMQKVELPKFLSRVLNEGPFCDSDKFSLVFTFSHVMGNISDSVKKMMEDGELSPVGMLPEANEQHSDPTYIRRMYLQDLYRFFRLFPQYRFPSFFEKQNERIAFIFNKFDCEGSWMCVEFCKFLIRRDELKFAEYLLDSSDVEDCEVCMLKAALYQRQKRYQHAMPLYQRLLGNEKNKMKVLSAFGRCAFETGQYKEASIAFSALKAEYPDNVGYEMNYLMSMIYDGKAQDVMNDVYRLDFQKSDDISVKRLVAWALLMSKRTEQAEKILSDIADSRYGEPEASDILNLAYATWFNKDVARTILLLTDYVQREYRKWPNRNLDVDFMNIINHDKLLLDQYGITALDVSLMIECVRKEMNDRSKA